MSERISQPNATRHVVLINGLPASGKTMMGKSLSSLLGAPLLSLDTIKEAMFDVLGIGDREYNRSLGRACKEIIWSVIPDFPENSTILVDAWFGFPPYDLVTNGLQKAGVKNFVEIWCDAPGELLAKRYVERVGLRHKGHPGKEYGAELSEVAKRAAPMGIGPVLRVDMSAPASVNFEEVAGWVKQELGL